MSNLFASLQNAAQALTAFDRALGVTQNNVNNASAPGYVRQKASLYSLPFQPSNGLIGGVQSGPTQTTRDANAERSVWDQAMGFGASKQLASSLSGIEGIFDLSGSSGLPSAMSKLIQSFSAWSTSPNSAIARQMVLANAGNLATSFQQASAALSQTTASADQQINSTVSRINSLAAQIQQYNIDRRKTDQADPAADANVHNALEDLSSLVNFQALYQDDGTITVLVGGQTPLVIGEHLNALKAQTVAASSSAAFPNGVPDTGILDAQGQNVTALITSGKLGALLQFRNTVLPSLQGNQNQQGDLNTLAQGLADRVNGLLTSGQAAPGPPPVSGIPLFVYDTLSSGSVARTLAVNPAATPQSLAAADPTPPASGNGIALRLGGLANSTDPADMINGMNYVAFIGSVGARIGTLSSDAQTEASRREQMVASAKALRSELSGISLDEEAVQLLQFQRAYQATARMVSVIDDLTNTVLGMIR